MKLLHNRADNLGWQRLDESAPRRRQDQLLLQLSGSRDDTAFIGSPHFDGLTRRQLLAVTESSEVEAACQPRDSDRDAVGQGCPPMLGPIRIRPAPRERDSEEEEKKAS